MIVTGLQLPIQLDAYSVFAAIYIIWLLIVTIKEIDFWPFSHYFMFSRYPASDRMYNLRLALVFEDGTERWWKPGFLELHRDYPLEFNNLLASESTSIENKITAIQRVIDEDRGLSAEVEVILIYERYTELPRPGKLQQKVISKIPAKAFLQQFHGRA